MYASVKFDQYATYPTETVANELGVSKDKVSDWASEGKLSPSEPDNNGYPRFEGDLLVHDINQDEELSTLLRRQFTNEEKILVELMKLNDQLEELKGGRYVANQLLEELKEKLE